MRVIIHLSYFYSLLFGLYFIRNKETLVIVTRPLTHKCVIHASRWWSCGSLSAFVSPLNAIETTEDLKRQRKPQTNTEKFSTCSVVFADGLCGSFFSRLGCQVGRRSETRTEEPSLRLYVSR